MTGGDPKALEVAAHGLKGAVGLFGTTGAFEAASRRERMARAEELGHAEEAFGELEHQIARLNSLLVPYGTKVPG